jgi:hypothetical protein
VIQSCKAAIICAFFLSLNLGFPFEVPAQDEKKSDDKWELELTFRARLIILKPTKRRKVYRLVTESAIYMIPESLVSSSRKSFGLLPINGDLMVDLEALVKEWQSGRLNNDKFAEEFLDLGLNGVRALKRLGSEKAYQSTFVKLLASDVIDIGSIRELGLFDARRQVRRACRAFYLEHANERELVFLTELALTKNFEEAWLLAELLGKFAANSKERAASLLKTFKRVKGRNDVIFPFLKGLSQPWAVPELLKMIDSEDRRVRGQSLQALFGIGGPYEVDKLAHTLNKTKRKKSGYSKSDKLLLIGCLGASYNALALPELLIWSNEKEAGKLGVKRAIERLSGKKFDTLDLAIEWGEAQETFVLSLQENQEKLEAARTNRERKDLLEKLKAVPDYVTGEILKVLLTHPETGEIREELCQILASFKEIRATNALLQILKTAKDEAIKRAAHLALKIIHNRPLPGHVDLWLRFLKKRYPQGIHGMPVELAKAAPTKTATPKGKDGSKDRDLGEGEDN